MHKNRAERLQFVAQYFKDNHSPTFIELQNLIAQKFSPIKERMLRQDLSYLRDEGINGIPLNIKEKDGRYYLAEERSFDNRNLGKYEKATLPFLFGLLMPYRHLASVDTLINTLIVSHQLNQDEVNQASFVFDVKQPAVKPKSLNALNEVFLAIHEQCAIDFVYKKVGIGGDLREDNTTSYVRLFPLQIRLYEGLYYLIGLKLGAEISAANLRLYRVDRIIMGPDIYLDEETEQPIHFNWVEMSKITELETYYEHCIGVLRDYNLDRQPKIIYRWFRSWAASFVLARPLHNSQKVIRFSENNEVLISLLVYETKELEAMFLRFGADSWVD